MIDSREAQRRWVDHLFEKTADMSLREFKDFMADNAVELKFILRGEHVTVGEMVTEEFKDNRLLEVILDIRNLKKRLDECDAILSYVRDGGKNRL